MRKERNIINENMPILLVEDDKVDAMTVKRALRETNIVNKLVIRENGVEALEHLQEKSNTRPCIILLDLNMPKMNGVEFLEKIKSDKNLKSIPVIVLTTSDELDDKKSAFEHSAAGYMLKPVDYNQFVDTMNSIKQYWVLSELPQ